MDPDERRQRFLERNRAAASRCRQKRKLWVNSLEKKADDLANMNVSLTVSLPFPSSSRVISVVEIFSQIGLLDNMTRRGMLGMICVLYGMFMCCHQNEVSLLRNEVAQLKQLLLAHKDCPVTVMQKKAAFLGNYLRS